MLMNSRGGPPFGGCMLMNSRGGPPFGEGVHLGTISMDPVVHMSLHCNVANQGAPRRSPGAFLDPPPPKATPLDPLGIYRCLGYNFRVGNLLFPNSIFLVVVK